MSKLSIPVRPEDHIQGDLDAGLNLVEYGDYECPYCGEAFPIVKMIQESFGKRLSFVFRNFPLTRAHPWAESAAEVAEFAGANGKFWPMHDQLFENQSRFGEETFLGLARSLKLSVAPLQSALIQQTYRERVQADFVGGIRSGVNGTPTFFINGQRHNGPIKLSSLSAAIERASSGHHR